MHATEIAHKILSRPNRLSQLVMQNEMAQSLGPEGFGEALRLGWLHPDTDSGFLYVSSAATHVEQLSALNEFYTMSAPPPSAPGAQGQDDDADVGDEVVVADNGTPYRAVVSARGTNGQYNLSFKGPRPQSMRPWTRGDIRVINRVNPAAHPGQPITQPIRSAMPVVPNS